MVLYLGSLESYIACNSVSVHIVIFICKMHYLFVSIRNYENTSTLYSIM
uniref:Uncharacterized protein n=1 Tax=Anguilla anguilla TaxID=7936 RepID=A0A0E9PKF6_ANGAN